MLLPKVGTFEFLAEPFHVDLTGHLTMGVMGNHILNCAGMHASQRGFGITNLNEVGRTWVLSRIAFEFSEFPYQYQNFKIDTWIQDVTKYFTKRNFAVYKEDGTEIGQARSVWCMIDVESRKPVDLFTIQGGNISDYVFPERENTIAEPSRIKVNADLPTFELMARYSDIDINGHFNSIRYIEHILDLFPIEKFRDSRLKRFEIAYVNECRFGETLQYYLDDNGDNHYAVEVRNKETGMVICRSLVIFC